jgi:GGDEF domain-containing protein
MGGDEFLIILSGADLEATERVVRRLQTAALDTAPVSFSLGWAARQGSERLEDTANRADHVLLDVRVVMRPEKFTRRSESDAAKGSPAN